MKRVLVVLVVLVVLFLFAIFGCTLPLGPDPRPATREIVEDSVRFDTLFAPDVVEVCAVFCSGPEAIEREICDEYDCVLSIDDVLVSVTDSSR